jgi:hypothetical protein
MKTNLQIERAFVVNDMGGLIVTWPCSCRLHMAWANKDQNSEGCFGVIVDLGHIRMQLGAS